MQRALHLLLVRFSQLVPHQSPAQQRALKLYRLLNALELPDNFVRKGEPSVLL